MFNYVKTWIILSVKPVSLICPRHKVHVYHCFILKALDNVAKMPILIYFGPHGHNTSIPLLIGKQKCSNRQNMQILPVNSTFLLEWSHNYCQMWVIVYLFIHFLSNCTCQGETSGLPTTHKVRTTQEKNGLWRFQLAEFAGFRPDFQHRHVGLGPRLNHPKGRTGCLLHLMINTALFYRGALQFIRFSYLFIYLGTESPQCPVIAAAAVPF